MVRALLNSLAPPRHLEWDSESPVWVCLLIKIQRCPGAVPRTHSQACPPVGLSPLSALPRTGPCGAGMLGLQQRLCDYGDDFTTCGFPFSYHLPVRNKPFNN